MDATPCISKATFGLGTDDLDPTATTPEITVTETFVKESFAALRDADGDYDRAIEQGTLHDDTAELVWALNDGLCRRVKLASESGRCVATRVTDDRPCASTSIAKDARSVGLPLCPPHWRNLQAGTLRITARVPLIEGGAVNATVPGLSAGYLRAAIAFVGGRVCEPPRRHGQRRGGRG